MSRPIRIQRQRTKGWSIKKAVSNGLPTVVVTRPSRWGNPFTVKGEWEQARRALIGHGPGVTSAIYADAQQAAVSKFRDMMLDLNSHPVSPEVYARFRYMRDRIRDLEGKNVACWCAAESPCHGDVLLELSNHRNAAMITTEYTPGPWFISDDEVVSGFGLITRIVGYDIPDDETMPNARLIAAAPDLLAALQLAVAEENRGWQVMCGANKEMGFDAPKKLDWVINAELIIKKATKP